MGICSSSEYSHTATATATAKLVLYDGGLEEYSYPVKVSYVLQKNPAVFICNSDEMDFDDVVSAISDEEELLPGQLYFALPLTRLKQRIPAEEMAALAVKASLALTKSVGKKSGRHRKRNMVFAVDNGGNSPSFYEESGRRRTRNGGGSTAGGDTGVGGGGRRKKYSVKLNTIPE